MYAQIYDESMLIDRDSYMASLGLGDESEGLCELEPVVPGQAASNNPLRPHRLDNLVGQDLLKRMLDRVIENALTENKTLDHVLLSAQSGYGKTTVALIIAEELGVNLWQVQAPVSHEVLLKLREVMQDQDVLFIDEIHQMAAPKDSSSAEVIYQCLEDKVLVSGRGVLPFPDVTFIGATNLAGMLPEALKMRFPLQPQFQPYSHEDMVELCRRNASALGLGIDDEAAEVLAGASRGTPRVVNNYMRNAQSLAGGHIDKALAEETIVVLNATTFDGLTLPMQRVLCFMYTRAKRKLASGEVRYQASLASLATATGCDQKEMALAVEPYMVQRGLLAVGHGGRTLTAPGIERAKELLNGPA